MDNLKAYENESDSDTDSFSFSPENSCETIQIPNEKISFYGTNDFTDVEKTKCSMEKAETTSMSCDTQVDEPLNKIAKRESSFSTYGDSSDGVQERDGRKTSSKFPDTQVSQPDSPPREKLISFSSDGDSSDGVQERDGRKTSSKFPDTQVSQPDSPPREKLISFSSDEDSSDGVQERDGRKTSSKFPDTQVSQPDSPPREKLISFSSDEDSSDGVQEMKSWSQQVEKLTNSVSDASANDVVEKIHPTPSGSAVLKNHKSSAYRLRDKELPDEMRTFLKNLEQFWTKKYCLARRAPAVSETTFKKVLERILCEYSYSVS